VRFTLVKDLKKDKTMRPILNGLTLFTLLYLITDIFVKHSSFGVFARDVSLTLFGSEEEFIDPLTQASFLEFWHMEIFFMMMILLTLSAVYIRLSQKSSLRLFILNIVMIFAISSLLSLVLSYFVSPLFVYLYTFSYLLWHIVAIYMSLYSLWYLNYDSSI